MEERAIYLVGKKRPATFRDLRSWLDALRPDQLDSPALIGVGSDVLIVSALADVVPDRYGFDAGPVLLAGDLWKEERRGDY